MKMSINFDGLTAVEARALINFVTDKGPADEPVEPPKEPRRRKTAVAGEEDKPAEDSKDVISDGGNDDSVAKDSNEDVSLGKPKRRRKSRDNVPSESKPTSRKRRRSVSQAQAEPEAPVESADELSDADVAKAASEAAMSLGVDVVKELLVKAGVDNVSQLTQKARQEFLVNLDFQKKFLGGPKVDWDDDIPF